MPSPSPKAPLQAIHRQLPHRPLLHTEAPQVACRAEPLGEIFLIDIQCSPPFVELEEELQVLAFRDSRHIVLCSKSHPLIESFRSLSRIACPADPDSVIGMIGASERAGQDVLGGEILP